MQACPVDVGNAYPVDISNSPDPRYGSPASVLPLKKMLADNQATLVAIYAAALGASGEGRGQNLLEQNRVYGSAKVLRPKWSRCAHRIDLDVFRRLATEDLEQRQSKARPREPDSGTHQMVDLIGRPGYRLAGIYTGRPAYDSN